MAEDKKLYPGAGSNGIFNNSIKQDRRGSRNHISPSIHSAQPKNKTCSINVPFLYRGQSWKGVPFGKTSKKSGI